MRDFTSKYNIFQAKIQPFSTERDIYYLIVENKLSKKGICSIKNQIGRIPAD